MTPVFVVFSDPVPVVQLCHHVQFLDAGTVVPGVCLQHGLEIADGLMLIARSQFHLTQIEACFGQIGVQRGGFFEQGLGLGQIPEAAQSVGVVVDQARIIWGQ